MLVEVYFTKTVVSVYKTIYYYNPEDHNLSGTRSQLKLIGSVISHVQPFCLFMKIRVCKWHGPVLRHQRSNHILIVYFQVDGCFSKMPPCYKICYQLLKMRGIETKICQVRLRKFGSVIGVVTHILTRNRWLVISGWSAVRNQSMSVPYAWKCTCTNMFWKIICSWFTDRQVWEDGYDLHWPTLRMKVEVS
jgi:hypothetical protein